MSDPKPPEDLSERIRRIASTIAEEVDKLFDFDEQSPSILDAAASSLGSTMERWGRNPGLRRILGGVQRDEITSPGEPV